MVDKIKTVIAPKGYIFYEFQTNKDKNQLKLKWVKASVYLEVRNIPSLFFTFVRKTKSFRNNKLQKIQIIDAPKNKKLIPIKGFKRFTQLTLGKGSNTFQYKIK